MSVDNKYQNIFQTLKKAHTEDMFHDQLVKLHDNVKENKDDFQSVIKECFKGNKISGSLLSHTVYKWHLNEHTIKPQKEYAESANNMVIKCSEIIKNCTEAGIVKTEATFSSAISKDQTYDTFDFQNPQYSFQDMTLKDYAKFYKCDDAVKTIEIKEAPKLKADQEAKLKELQIIKNILNNTKPVAIITPIKSSINNSSINKTTDDSIHAKEISDIESISSHYSAKTIVKNNTEKQKAQLYQIFVEDKEENSTNKVKNWLNNNVQTISDNQNIKLEPANADIATYNLTDESKLNENMNDNCNLKTTVKSIDSSSVYYSTRGYSSDEETNSVKSFKTCITHNFDHLDQNNEINRVGEINQQTTDL